MTYLLPNNPPSVGQDKPHLLRINGNKAAHGTLTPGAKEQVPTL